MSIIFIIFISIITFIWPTLANADFSLGIFPPIIEITAKPPANVSTPLSIQNLGSESLNLQIVFKPFSPSDQEDGQVKFLKKDEISSDSLFIYERIKIFDESKEIKELTLGPKQKKELTLNINIPRDTIAQDYYSSIVFVSLPSQLADRNVTQSLGGLATNVLLSIGDTVLASGVIQEFSSPIFIEKGPVPFTVRVKNTGNHFIAPKGEIIIRSLLGEEVGRVGLLPVNILAKSVRSIPSEDQIDKSLWKENIIIGPYRAVLNLSLSESGPKFQRELIFFAFPAGWLVGTLGLLATLLYLISRVRRKV